MKLGDDNNYRHGDKGYVWVFNKLDFPQQPTSRRNDLSIEGNFHDSHWSLESSCALS